MGSTPVDIHGALVAFDPLILTGPGGGEDGLPGAKGDPGITPQLAIGTVSSVPSGQTASASITGTASDPILNLILVDGPSADSGSSDPVVVGSGASSTSTGQVAIGQGAATSNTDAVAIGQASSATGPFSTAIGQESEADGHGSVGINGTATANFSVAVGPGSTAGGSGTSQVALGSNATASGDESIAIGDGVEASGNGSVAIGVDSSGTPATTSTDNEFVLGTDQHTVHIPGNLVVDGTGGGGAVSSVNTQTGAVVLTASDVSAQPVDSDLTTIAGLTATTDSFMQSKSSAWAARTVAQVKTDLGLTGTNSGDQTGGTPAVVLGTAAAAGTSVHFLRDDDTIVAFDVTAPSTQAYGDSAVVGTAPVAAHRDHKHAMPASLALTRQARTGNFNAAVGDIEALDTSSGTFAATIPAASGGKGRIVLKWTAGTLPPSITLSGSDHFNTSTGSTSTTPVMQNESLQLESDGSSLWTLTADGAPPSLLALTLVFARNTWS